MEGEFERERKQGFLVPAARGVIWKKWIEEGRKHLKEEDWNKWEKKVARVYHNLSDNGILTAYRQNHVDAQGKSIGGKSPAEMFEKGKKNIEEQLKRHNSTKCGMFGRKGHQYTRDRLEGLVRTCHVLISAAGTVTNSGTPGPTLQAPLTEAAPRPAQIIVTPPTATGAQVIKTPPGSEPAVQNRLYPELPSDGPFSPPPYSPNNPFIQATLSPIKTPPPGPSTGGVGENFYQIQGKVKLTPTSPPQEARATSTPNQTPSYGQGKPRWTDTPYPKHFRNHDLATVEASLGLTHKFGAVYHPQSQGKVERMNQNMKQKLAKTMEETGLNWLEALPLVLLVIRSTICRTTGFSPYEMTHGHQFPGPGAGTTVSKELYERVGHEDYYKQLKCLVAEFADESTETRAKGHTEEAEGGRDVEYIRLKTVKPKWCAPRFTGPHKVTQRTDHAVRLEGKGDTWYHWSRCVAAPTPTRTLEDTAIDLEDLHIRSAEGTPTQDPTEDNGGGPSTA